MRQFSLITVLLFLLIGGLHSQDTHTDADSFDRWKIRVRGLAVIPNESAEIQSIGGDVNIDVDYVPEIDFTYFFSKNWAAEIILATTKHDVQAVGTDAGDIPLGDVRLLPPTLTLQYHISGQSVHPYVGAGLNLTLFYDQDPGSVADAIDYENSLGYVFQAGIDFDLTSKWFLNIDAKYVLLDTDVQVDATTALGAVVDAQVDINPFIPGIGIGVRF